MNEKQMEAAIDIALNAGNLIATKKINVEDSRELVATIQQWAQEFEQTGYGNEDYLTEIDAFADTALRERYGREVL